MIIFRLITAALIPVLFAVIFYLLEKNTGFAKLNFIAKQIIIGIVFGSIAILSTEFGVPANDAVINVRNASPLISGLVFGGPAGIIAGVIGGVHRWLCVLWGSGGMYTRLACSLATIFAGLFGAFCRKYMFENKKPTWFYGLIIGMTTEVMHMLLIFLTNMNDINTAFTYVRKCSAPMIIASGLSVMAALFAVSLIGKEKTKKKKSKRQLAQIFQFFLFICVVISFIIACAFTGMIQTKIAYSNAEKILELNLKDVKSYIIEASDAHLMDLTRNIASNITFSTSTEELYELARTYKVSEINIVDEHGVIITSTSADFVGFDMGSGEQSAEFLTLLEGKEEYVQEYRPISIDSMLYMKYAGVAIENGFVQVGYNASRFQEDIAEQVRYAAKNRHIGKAGFVMICDENFNVASSPYEEQIGEPIDFESKLTIKEILKIEGTIFEARGKMNYSSYCMFLRSEGYFIIASLPVEEAMFSRDIAVYVTVFMLSLVFAALFIHIYFLIKRLVVNNIHKVNSSLSQITDGNLNVKIDVRENEEFTSLSDDINSTVDTLKHYIDEAKARIDKELEFAKNIQHSALPNIFPPYPNRHEFDIYATMDAAKEVGGDFYDFYLMDNDRLCFLVADVSGKSIPGAMFMMRSKTILKSLAESGIEAGEIFTKANEKLCEGNDAGMFVTAWLGIIDIRSGILTYANAGHNPPLLRHKNGKFEYLRTRPNFVLAGMEGAKYRKNELQLLPGDEIFLYTDGVTEATDKNNELFGEDRLLSALNRNPDVSVENRCRAVKREIDKFVGDADQFDDITMLTVKTHFFQNYDSIMTSPDEASVEPVWEFINRKMKKAALPVKLANKVQIVVDEIYSNILRYSGATKAEVFCSIDEKDLTLTFKDNGVPYDPLQKNDPDITLSADDREIGGLGIFMVKKMASSIKYENTDGLNILKITFGI